MVEQNRVPRQKRSIYQMWHHLRRHFHRWLIGVGAVAGFITNIENIVHVWTVYIWPVIHWLTVATVILTGR